MLNKEHGKNVFSKKMLVLLAALLLVFTVGVGGTLAYLIDRTEDVTNTFTPSEIKLAIDEEGWNTGNFVKSNVTVRNVKENSNDTKATAAYIRAAIVINWKDEQGNVYGKAPVEGVDYTILYGSEWEKGNDDYYYYKNEVQPGASTSALIETCTVNKAAPHEGYTLSVEILAQGVQSVPDDAVIDAWGDEAVELVGATE